VERVLPGESSDPRARSPFAAPGVAVREGDEILAVDGRPLDPVHGPWPALAGTHGKPVELTIKPADPSLVPRPPAEPEEDADEESDAKDAEGAGGTEEATDAARPAAAEAASAEPTTGEPTTGEAATAAPDGESAGADASASENGAASPAMVSVAATGSSAASASAGQAAAGAASGGVPAVLDGAPAVLNGGTASGPASGMSTADVAESGGGTSSADTSSGNPGAAAGTEAAPGAEQPAEAPALEFPATRRVVIVPLYDDRRLRYQDWVAGRRAFVRTRSDGRVGYLHVPDMMGEGWAHLHRDLRAEMGRDALIVDVRGNRGGHTSQLIVEKLARRIIGWKIPRHLRPYSYPQEARRGPLVALTDEFAGSDGDIVTAAIKTLGLGPVIGTRTWGGVVGIDGSGHGLVDGTRITIPRYASWFTEFGWSVENYGVDPDTEVFITPDDWAVGHDPQLEVAVDRALALLEENPRPPLPDPSEGPAKRRPPLPPRP
jgi:C-terminal processing protease CtpA/Prc